MKQIPLDLGIREVPTLESFVGSGNLMLRAMVALQSVGEGELQLYLHGPSGCGRTHLAQAACHHANDQGLTAAFLPLKSLHRRMGQAFEGLERLDLVVLDDVDAVTAHHEDAFALFDLINRLREQDRRLLMTASRPPRELPLDFPDLVTRLGWGTVLGIREPTDAEKIDLLQVRARQRGFELPFETGMYLLRMYRRDVAALIALLGRLDRASMIEHRRLTVRFVRDVLSAASTDHTGQGKSLSYHEDT
ncbi:MAG: DnaA regulatory inactivator Hda [Halothiobacillaceae bacterium]